MGSMLQSAAEVRAALEAVRSATSSGSIAAEVAASTDSSRPSWINRAWIGAVVVVVIAGFLWAYSGRGRGGGEGSRDASVAAGAEGLAIGASGRPSHSLVRKSRCFRWTSTHRS